jgi:hypothetical protein
MSRDTFRVFWGCFGKLNDSCLNQVGFGHFTHPQGNAAAAFHKAESSPSRTFPRWDHGFLRSCSRARQPFGLRIRETSGSLTVLVWLKGRATLPAAGLASKATSAVHAREPHYPPEQAPGSRSAPPKYDGLYGTGEEHQVQPHRPVADVIGVHPDPFAEGGVVAPGHLPRSCYPWRHA